MSWRNVRTGSTWTRLAPALPVATLLAGAAFSAWLASRVPEGIFYSGDGGVKFALTRQFSEGDLRPDLRLPAEPWVSSLWGEGHYPLAPPFAYEIGNKRFIQYPVFFSLITAPLYRVLGWTGLFTIPLAALWATWVTFLVLMRRRDVGPVTASLALGAMIFASPLTIYGATYWEHTLAVSMAFGGLALLMRDTVRASTRSDTVGASLVACSSWFRSEHLVLTSVVAILVLRSRRSLPSGWRRALLVGGFSVPLLVHAAINVGLYGIPLGAHALSVVGPVSPLTRAANAAQTLGDLATLLAAHFPVGLVALAGATLAHRSRRHEGEHSRPDAAHLAGWACILYFLLLPAILPAPELDGDGGKQWGPRFLLVLVPFAVTVAALSARDILAVRPRALRFALSLALAGSFAVGAWLNTYRGALDFVEDHRERMLPLLQFLRADPARVVASSEQFAFQELMTLSPDRSFLLVASPDELEHVASVASEHGESRLIFLSDQLVEGRVPIAVAGRSAQLSIRPIARFGWRLVAHEVLVQRLAR